jgi:hypothetical protein
MCNIWAGDPSLLRLQVAVVVVILEAKVSVIISSSLPDMKVKFCKIYNHNEAMLYHTKITINGKNNFIFFFFIAKNGSEGILCIGLTLSLAFRKYIFSAESTLICLQDVKLSLD